MMKIKIIILTLLLGFFASSCTEKWAEMNQDPSKMTNPPVPEQMFTHSLYNLGSYQYTEWFYDAYHYFYPWGNYTVWGGGNSATVNEMGATGDVLGALYLNVMPMTFELRKTIKEMENQETKDLYQHLYAISYIPQAMQAIKASDVYGSIVYSQSMQGRYEGNYSPEYDTQQELYDILLGELTDAIETLSTVSLESQVDLSFQDFVYRGDNEKWIKLANTLKLRIANRLMGQNPTKATSVINEVVSDSYGPIVDIEDEFRWSPATNYRGTAHDLYGIPTAPKNACDFMRENRDPRLRFLFRQNAFDQDAVDDILANSLTKPSFIPDVINEPWDRYFGGPCSPDQASNLDYFGPYVNSSGNSVQQLSRLNQRLQNPNYQNGTGWWVDVMVPASEACLYIAEYIQTGVLTGNVMGQSAQGWYEQGVENSIRSLDYVAEVAQIFDYSILKLDDAEIALYLAQPDIAWGSNNLEKIYVQQFLNFYRMPYEGFANIRRTGYPRVGSSLLAYEPLVSSTQTLAIPRRFPLMETDDEWNGDNYRAAVAAQGFTLGANDAATLSTERVWWDIPSPGFGNGK